MVQQRYGLDNTAMVPSVEDVQDIVESILIEEGLSDTAKAYILYRHERRKVRDEKMKILNKKDLDEVDKAFDVNSLRVLAARYLLRDNNNEIIEGPKSMFERVAVLVTIPDMLHDTRIFSLAEGILQNIQEAEKYYSKIDDFDMKLKIGDYYLNKYHFEAMIRHYVYLAKGGHMKVSFKELLRIIAEGSMSAFSERIIEYYNLMVSRDFLPNTPTLMNAGAKLGQLSACFVLDMPDDMSKIMKSSTDAAPMRPSIRRTSSSVWGVKFMPRTRCFFSTGQYVRNNSFSASAAARSGRAQARSTNDHRVAGKTPCVLDPFPTWRDWFMLSPAMARWLQSIAGM